MATLIFTIIMHVVFAIICTSLIVDMLDLNQLKNKNVKTTLLCLIFPFSLIIFLVLISYFIIKDLIPEIKKWFKNYYNN